MDYYDLFHPILSHGAHLFLAAGAGEMNSAIAFSALERQIATVLDQRRPSHAESFDQAWFPVAAWLNEKLARLGLHIPGAAIKHQNAGTPVDAEFFRRLDVLLAKDDGGIEKSLRRDLTRIYHACLTLGFLGCHDRPDTCAELESYRLRCLDALAETDGEQCFGGKNQRETAKPGVRLGKLRGMTAFWAFPFLITLGLFLLYRILLTDLFQKVFE